jgi:Spy/CpxP family protein refolding chaperone
MGPRLRAGLALASVFTLGVLAGVALERYRSGRGSEVEHEAVMTELVEELELDPVQVERIHAVFAKHREVVQQSWEELRPEVQSAMRDVHFEIAELLTPEQRRRFHEWLMQRRENP